MKSFLLPLVIVSLSKILFAQAPNNNIQNRLALDLNGAPIRSSTAQSTVEWECINKALTNKCLVYHNDQWFNFSVPEAGQYFINISEQKCRDLRGLQLIVIEGNPCETKTYRILHCIPKIIQDDVFVQLDSLKPNTKYLINMDGFLGDFCEFGIQISEKPNGFPRHYQTLDTVKAQTSRKGRLVDLEWTVNEGRIDQFQSFKVYLTKPNGIKSDLIHEKPVARNSYGTYVLTYSVRDSLQKVGRYSYRIVGIQKQTQLPFLLASRIVDYQETKLKVSPQKSFSLNLDFKDKTALKILIYNETDQSMLSKQIIEFDDTPGHPLAIDLSEFIESGVREFMILVSEKDAQSVLEFYYFFNGERLIRK